MATVPEAFAIALQHHQAGRLQAAEAIYQQILRVEPTHADAWHLLGVIHSQTGKHGIAVEYIVRALTLRPHWAEAYINLGNAFRGQGKLEDAIAAYRRAVELRPDFAEAHYNLGKALADRGKLEDAIAAYRRALELKPDFAEVPNNLGVALSGLGKLEDAIAAYRRALELKPDFAEVPNNLGVALSNLGRLEDAIAVYRRALELRPDFAEAHSNLGAALADLGKLEEAIACHRRALELKPDFAEAQNNLGNALRELEKLEEAIACHRRALELKPDFAEAQNNLGAALADQRKLEDAIAAYRRALELRPDYAEAHSNLLCALQYRTGVTPAALAEAHAEFDRRHAATLRRAGARHEKIHDPPRQPRLGFVSPDLGRHPVGYFLVRTLEDLSRGQQETTCYSDRIIKDDLTHRLQAAATRWRDVFGMSHERLAEQVRADRIDILFDLAGHTGRNRLLVFARKPAPIQLTWMGYVGTTGLSAIDYLIADRYEVPEGAEGHYRERVIRLPDGYVCYDPPSYAPDVGPLPASGRGAVTFGSFNNPSKTGPEVIAVWSEILRRLPSSRLLLKYKGLDDESLRRRYLDLFSARGVGADRVVLEGWSSNAATLATYNRVDIALDTFPYSGGLTTCEALWMGVPVITCPGDTFAGRHSLSHLSNVGLTETIAQDRDEYVELAVALAGDPPRLAALRSGLRGRMAASPLCDGKRFATNLMALLHDVWERWIG